MVAGPLFKMTYYCDSSSSTRLLTKVTSLFSSFLGGAFSRVLVELHVHQTGTIPVALSSPLHDLWQEPRHGCLLVSFSKIGSCNVWPKQPFWNPSRLQMDAHGLDRPQKALWTWHNAVFGFGGREKSAGWITLWIFFSTRVPSMNHEKIRPGMEICPKSSIVKIP